VITVSHSRILALAFLLLLAAAVPASAYGRSVEDLVGSFSIEKAIKIGSSSECFSDSEANDPLTPPQSPGAGPLADDQPPSLAGFAFEPTRILAASVQPINFTATSSTTRAFGQQLLISPALPKLRMLKRSFKPRTSALELRRTDSTLPACFFFRRMKRATGI